MEKIHIPKSVERVPYNIVNNFETSETSPGQAAFDLGVGFSLIFPFIWPSKSFWRENKN